MALITEKRGAESAPPGPGLFFHGHGDGISDFYSGIADDSNRSSKEREAAMLYCVAEDHLNGDENLQAADRSALQAIAAFRELGDFRGVSDSARLRVHCFQMKADFHRFQTQFGYHHDIRDTLKEADAFARDEMSRFKEKGYTYGQASMLLSLAELNLDKRGRLKRDLALDCAKEAVDMFRAEQEAKMEALTLLALHDIHFRNRMPTEALECAEKAAEVLESLDDRMGLVKALQRVALSHGMNRDMRHALDCQMEALDLCRELGLRKIEGYHLNTIATWHLALERPREALPAAKEAVAIFEELDMGLGWQGAAVRTLIEAHMACGDGKAALRLAKANLLRFEEKQDTKMRIYLHEMLGRVYFARACQAESLDPKIPSHREEIKDAVEHAERALELARELGDRATEADLLNTCHKIYRRCGELQLAARCLQQAAQCHQRVGNLNGEGEMYFWLAELHLETGNLEEALQASKASFAAYERKGNGTGMGANRVVGSKILMGYNFMDDAIADAKRGIDAFKAERDPANEAVCWSILCDIHQKQGNKKQALEDATARRKTLQTCQEVKAAASGYHLEAQMYMLNKEFEKAAKIAWQAHVACKKIEDRQGEVEALNLVMNIVVQSGEDGPPNKMLLEQVGRASKEAKHAAKKLGDANTMGLVIYWQACVVDMLGDKEEAWEVASEALPLMQRCKDKKGEGEASLLMAKCSQDVGENQRAVDEATKALELFQEAEDKELFDKAVAFLVKLGVYGQPGALVMNPMTVASPAGSSSGRAASKAAASASESRISVDVIRSSIKKFLLDYVEGEDFSFDTPLMDAGLDSLSSVNFRNEVAQHFEVQLSASFIFDFPTPDSMIEHLTELLDAK